MVLCISSSGGTIGVIIMKLGMYMLCRKSSDSSVQAFALDHINDVVVNSVGLAGETLPPFPQYYLSFSCQMFGPRQITHSLEVSACCWSFDYKSIDLDGH